MNSCMRIEKWLICKSKDERAESASELEDDYEMKSQWHRENEEAEDEQREMRAWGRRWLWNEIGLQREIARLEQRKNRN